MKKKILIVSHALELGGAERSLIGLLDSVNPDIYDTDLFLLRREGELMDMIPPYINLLREIPSYTVLARPMKETLREGHFLLTAARAIGKTAAALYNKRKNYTDSGVALEYSHKYTCPFMPEIQASTEYDLAISFLTPHYFVAQKVRAKKKIAWIHTDYAKVQVNNASENKMWSAYNSIVSISPAVTEGFLTVFPNLKEKIIQIENILPRKLAEQQSEMQISNMNYKGIKLLSIGRFCTAKNFDNIPDICSRLVGMGFDIRWYLIGFGGDESLIRSKIKETRMEERVIILGKKQNPYPYIKACSLYVQPSRYEGKSVSVREAQIFGKPVVITDYATAYSQLENRVDGIIVPLDNEGCANGIAALLKNPGMMKKLSEECLKRDYSNAQEINKLYRILED